SYSYTWFSGTTQMQSVTTTLPVVTSAENGPGVADTNTTYFDVYGRTIWQKDGDGFIKYTAYDQATGGRSMSWAATPKRPIQIPTLPIRCIWISRMRPASIPAGRPARTPPPAQRRTIAKTGPAATPKY